MTVNGYLFIYDAYGNAPPPLALGGWRAGTEYERAPTGGRAGAHSAKLYMGGPVRSKLIQPKGAL